MTREAETELTEASEQTSLNTEGKKLEDALDTHAAKKNSVEIASLADRLQVLMERCIDAFEKTAY